MPSSTFSFDISGHVPSGNWGRIWILTLLTCACVLGGWEVILRVQGYPALIPDDYRTWAHWRHRVREDSTVLIGTSRMQSDIDPEIWGEIDGSGRDPIQLALPHATSIEIFESLADDPNFAGVAVMDLVPFYHFNRALSNQPTLDGLEEYEAGVVSPAALLESWLAWGLRGHFALRTPPVSLTALTHLVLQRRWSWPERPRARMRANRFVPLDVRGYERKSWDRYEYYGSPMTEEEQAALEARIERAVERIHARGGDVVIVSLPSCGKREEIEEKRFPRARFWDPFASRTAAITIHADAYPELSDFPCADGSHVDYRDVDRFTRALHGVVWSRIRERRERETSISPRADGT